MAFTPSDLFVPLTTGPAIIYWAGNSIGYAEDRVMMRVQPFWDLVHSDGYGGLAGPPADRQLLGAVVQIMATITTFTSDLDLIDDLHTFSSGKTTNGTVVLPAVGSFARQDGLADTLIIEGRGESRTFSPATLTEAQELNSSARHRRFQMGWTAEVDDACARNLMVIVVPGTDPCGVS
jgi:hypothetical protein